MRRDVVKLKVLFVEFFVAVLAEPHQAVEFARLAFSFDNETDGILATNRIVRNARREQKHLALANCNLPIPLSRWTRSGVGGGVAFITAPPADFVPEPVRGHPVVGVIITYAGPPEAGMEVLSPLREFGPPTTITIKSPSL